MSMLKSRIFDSCIPGSRFILYFCDNFVINNSRRFLFSSKAFNLQSSAVSDVSRGKSSFVLGRNILKLRDLGLLQSVLPRNRYFSCIINKYILHLIISLFLPSELKSEFKILILFNCCGLKYLLTFNFITSLD